MNTTAKQSAMIEYSSLIQPGHCPLGIYLIPSTNNILVWNGVLFIHKGYYASAVLHFTLTIPITYPSTPPLITFQTNLYHPLINPLSGHFNLDSKFSSSTISTREGEGEGEGKGKWIQGKHFIYHILFYLKSSFKKDQLDLVKEEDCENREAWRLYRENTPIFAKLASKSSSLTISHSALYSTSTPSATINDHSKRIQFRKLDEIELEEVRDKLEESGRNRMVKKA